MKKIKAPNQAHTSNQKTGSGDYYGQAVKQNVGRIVDVMGFSPLASKKLKKPPRSLA